MMILDSGLLFGPPCRTKPKSIFPSIYTHGFGCFDLTSIMQLCRTIAILELHWLCVYLSTWQKSYVLGSGNRHPIPAVRVPAVAMIGWHVARLPGCGLVA